MPTSIEGLRTPAGSKGVAVIGEALRRVPPERAEFLIEISVSASSAAQALRDNHVKTTQVGQAVAAMGVQPADMQTISLNVYSLYSPAMQQALPGYGAVPQIGQPSFTPYTAGSAAAPQEVQFGAYYARNTLRVNVREPGRLGEIVDSVTRAGANVLGGFSFHAADEAAARRAVLEAAGRDAKAKAETLATATGKQIGDPVAVTEDIVASNGTYSALRSSMPFAFGAGAPQVAGELEYYARISATFRLQ